MRGLYVIIDPEHCRGRDPLMVADAALRGGCAALQLRTKTLADRPRLALARAVAARCRATSVPFWMNDRIDLALLSDAAGVHLGQDDLSVDDARTLWATRPLGRSTHSLAQARAAERDGADVIGFGPVFTTTSKHNPDPTVGLELLGEVCRAVQRPVVAIGGIQQAHTQALVRAGAAYVAVISAVCSADDPEHAARALHTALRDAG